MPSRNHAGDSIVYTLTRYVFFLISVFMLIGLFYLNGYKFIESEYVNIYGIIVDKYQARVSLLVFCPSFVFISYSLFSRHQFFRFISHLVSR